jgi:hemolysin III
MQFLELREPANALTHVVGFVLAWPGTVVLWRRSRGDRPKQISLLIFGLSLIFCYGGSVLYHSVKLPLAQVDWFETVDYLGISLLIAGSSTPVIFNLLQGRWRWRVLTMTWTLALISLVLRVAYWDAPRWIYTSIYLVMGWSMVLCYSEMARLVTHRSMALILLGGLLYSIGAAINVFNWPVLWRGTFGAHALFHVFVLAGSLVHYWFMLRVVVPYERVSAEAVAASPDADAVASPLAPGRLSS